MDGQVFSLSCNSSTEDALFACSNLLGKLKLRLKLSTASIHIQLSSPASSTDCLSTQMTLS